MFRLSIASLFGRDSKVLRKSSFQLLFIANLAAPLGTTLLSPILDSLTEPLGASPAEIGLMVSAFTAPPIFLIPLAGTLADRYGRKPILVAGLVTFGAGGTAVAFTTEFHTVLALRVLQGIGYAAITPTIITSIGDLYAGSEETAAQGFRFTGSGMTQTVFPLLAAGLVTIAWQYPFLVYAISFPIAAMIYVWFDEPSSVREPSKADEGARSQLKSLFDLVFQRHVSMFLILRGLPTVVWIAFLTYNSVIVVHLMDGSPAQAGVLAAVGSIAYASSATQVGRITTYFDNIFYPLIAANCCLGAGFVLVLFSPTLSVGIIGIFLAGAGFGVAISIFRSIMTGLAPDNLRGSLVSLSESFGRLMTTLTPVAMGAYIGAMTPSLGLQLAVQTAGIYTTVLASGTSVICLLLASTSSRIALPIDA